MSNELIITAVLFERLADVIPASYAYLLLYLWAKCAERSQDFLVVSYARLGDPVGLTKATIGRGLKRLESLDFIRRSLDARSRHVIHVNNIGETLNHVKSLKSVTSANRERNDSETVPKRQRNDSETTAKRSSDEREPLLPKPGSSPSGSPISDSISSVFDTSTSTPVTTPGIPPLIVSPPKKSRFKKPEPNAVTEYARSIGFHLDGHQFCDFYESKGWKVGQTAMKSWQAAVRTWKRTAGPAELFREKPRPRPRAPEPEPLYDMTPEEMDRIKQENMGPKLKPEPVGELPKEATIPISDVNELVLKLAGGRRIP